MNITLLPSAKVPLIYPDTNGMTTEWYRFFWNIYGFTGTGVVPVNKGGTGLDTIGDHQLIIGNANNVFEPTTLVGSGITITYGTGTVTLAIGNSGVTPGTYGSASKVGQFTVDVHGTLVFAQDVNIAIDASQIISGTINTARISGSYTGITGVGTLTAGTWNATTIGTGYGGTGQATYAVGDMLYATGTTALSKLTIGASTYILTSSGTAPQWTIPSSVAVGTATNLAGGGAGYVPYQSASGTTSFLGVGTGGQVLSSNGTSAPTWIGPSAFLNNITTTQGSIIYRNSVGWVSLNPGTSGQVLTTGGTGANPSWTTAATGTVTSVTGTSPVVSSGGTTPAISLATAYGDTLNPYASKTANYFLAAPNGVAGVPTFRAMVAADVPALAYVTSVSGTGSVNGITLTGTVTSSGSLTLGGTLGSIANSQLTNSTISGVALGSNLFNLTAGTGVSFSAGTTYNGSTAITITATGSGGTVTSVTGTAPVVSSGGTTPAISMAAATTSVNGYLTSTDWNTFNGKQPAGSYLTAVSVVSANGFAGTSSGGTTPALTLSTSITGILKGNGTAISAAASGTDYAPATSGTSILYGNGSGGFSNVTIGTGVSFVGGTLSATGSGGTVTSVTGTAPVVSSGGATPAISMAAANTTTNGYLTSTDWNTFNGKSNTNGTVTSVAALTLGTTGTDLSSTVATGTTTPVITLQVPTASATNRGALSSADWTTFNGKAPGVTFTTNYIPYGQGTTTLNQSAGLQFDGTNFTTTGYATATSFRPSASTIPTNGIYLPAANSLGFATNTTSRMTIDASGNLGLGVAPSAWNTGGKAVQVSNGGFFHNGGTLIITSNLYYDATYTPKYIASALAGSMLYNPDGSGGWAWFNAPSGTAGATATVTQAMTLFNSGGLSLGNTTDPGATNLSVTGSATAASFRPSSATVPTNGLYLPATNSIGWATNSAEAMRVLSTGALLIGSATEVFGTTAKQGIYKTGSLGDVATIQGTNAGSFYSIPIGTLVVDANAYNAANCAVIMGKNTVTSRSLNAGGTVNALGTDYAEYMVKSDNSIIKKGDICGINSEGKLTIIFSEAISFVVKSTNPSFVGGDSWGSVDDIGMKPNNDATQEEKDAHIAKLEIERQKVDRIAFAGQVPVNVLNAVAGQYIVPIEDNGSIKGIAVSNPTFEQYQISVGKVISIKDGIPTIIVKVA